MSYVNMKFCFGTLAPSKYENEVSSTRIPNSLFFTIYNQKERPQETVTRLVFFCNS